MGQKELLEIAKTIVSDDSHFGELFQANANLKALLVNASGIDLKDEMLKYDLPTPNGLAIGPHWAAICMDDLFRTTQFIKGLYKVILEAKKRFPDQRINLLYAGTGPFATLAIPMTALFKSDEIQFTFLDAIEANCEYVKQTVDILKLSEYVRKIECVDAAEYNVGKEVYHILLTECCQSGLSKEPQVAITLNMAHQIHENGIVVPEKITVDFGFINMEENHKRTMAQPYDENYIKVVKNLINLDKPFAIEHKSEKGVLAKNEIIPEEFNSTQDHKAALFTSITIFKGIEVKPFDCAMTYPAFISEIDPVHYADYEAIQFGYKLGKKPDFQQNIVKFSL